MSWIQTQSGREVDLLRPTVDTICIEDIAHALSHCCRFAGHTRVFYSVAQHCVLCSWIVDPKFALEALMHDAAEAYLGDITLPLKQLLWDAWNVLEGNLNAVIEEAFGLGADPLCWPAIKIADRIMLATECRDLMPREATPSASLEGIVPLDRRIEPWSSPMAECNFLGRFSDLVLVRRGGLADRTAAHTAWVDGRDEA